jgi:hypothetical protein
VYSVLLLPPGEETNAADTTGGICLLYNDRLPFHHGWIQKTAVPVDTCSDLCVYRHGLVPRHRERVNNEQLCAASGTTIHTY